MRFMILVLACALMGAGCSHNTTILHPKNKAQISKDAQIGPHVEIYGRTVISGPVKINGHVKIYNSTIKGNVELDGKVIISNSSVTGSPKLWGNVLVDSARISGSPTISDNVVIRDGAHVSGQSAVYGNASVFGGAKVQGQAKVSGNVRVSGNSVVKGNARLWGEGNVSGNAQIYGYASLYGQYFVTGNAKLHEYANVSGKGVIIGGNAEVKGVFYIKRPGALFEKVWNRPIPSMDGHMEYALWPKRIHDLENAYNQKGTLSKALAGLGHNFHPVAADQSKIYQTLKDAQKKIPLHTDLPRDGCFARAELLARYFEKQGIIVGKAFVETPLLYPNLIRPEQKNWELLSFKADKNKTVRWTYHVAVVALSTNDKGKKELLIIDPATSQVGVMPLEKWVHKIGSKTRFKLSLTHRYVIDPRGILLAHELKDYETVDPVKNEDPLVESEAFFRDLAEKNKI